MTRLLFEDDARMRRRLKSAATGDDQTAERPYRRSLDDEPGTSGPDGERKDSTGRRSLTGLEFRRQRSI
jgi:hypothetical protein